MKKNPTWYNSKSTDALTPASLPDASQIVPCKGSVSLTAELRSTHQRMQVDTTSDLLAQPRRAPTSLLHRDCMDIGFQTNDS